MSFSRFLLWIAIFSSFFLTAIEPFDFEILEGKGSSFWKKFSKEDHENLAFYKHLYTKQIAAIDSTPEDILKIPKVIHFIWLGPKEFPSQSIPFVLSWKEHHPDWTMKFWTDSIERPCPISGMEKHLVSEVVYQKLEKHLSLTEDYAEKSDLLRYEILYREGGIYVDHDIECFHNFERLHRAFDFYAGLEPPHRNAGIPSRIFPCNALIGVKKGHPILLATIDLVAKNWEEMTVKNPGMDPKSRFSRVMHRTFHPFSCAVRSLAGRSSNADIVFPASFFYADRIFSAKQREKLKEKKLLLASHRFAATWVDLPKKTVIKKEISSLKKAHRRLQKKIFHYKTGLLFYCIAMACFVTFFWRRT